MRFLEGLPGGRTIAFGTASSPSPRKRGEGEEASPCRDATTFVPLTEASWRCLNLCAFLGVFRFAKILARRLRADSPRGEAATYPHRISTPHKGRNAAMTEHSRSIALTVNGEEVRE